MRGVVAAELAGAIWRKSTFSGATGNCVEVARNLPGVVAVRDSKRSGGPVLVFSPGAWSAFVSGVRADEFAAS